MPAMRLAAIGFNGAAVVRPRREPLSTHRALSRGRFNGAAVVRPRRAAPRSRRLRRVAGFNGAAVVRPRREGCAVGCTLEAYASTGPRS